MSSCVTELAGKMVAITGARGYIGSALTMAAHACGARVIRVSRQTMAPMDGVEDVCGDPCQETLWSGIVSQADIVFHLAGETSVYAAEANPRASLDANVLPMLHLVQACKKSGRSPVVILASTVTVFGVEPRLPVRDGDPPAPCSQYDVQKLMAELQLAHGVVDGALRGCSLRLSNVYGLGPSIQGAQDRGILDRMVRKAMTGETLTVYGDGSQRRDYTHLDDVVNAFLLAAVSPQAWDGRAMMVAIGQSHSLMQAFQTVSERVAMLTRSQKVGVECNPWPASAHPIEYRDFVAAGDWMNKYTGWKPSIDLSDGIDKTIKDIIKNKYNR